jgi:hypothetical protein
VSQEKGLRGHPRGDGGGSRCIVCVCELASRFLAKPIQMSFAGLGNPPPSPPGRARHCALVGGYMRKEQARQQPGPEQASIRTCRPLPGPGPLAQALASCAGRDASCVCLRAREPIFSETHTDEFCGVGKSTPEPAGPCAPLRPGRWAYEKERLPALWGGRRGKSSAPLHGSLRRPLGPVSYIAALAWCPTVCRGTDDCGEHHLSTAAARSDLARALARHLGRLRSGAREYPVCAEGWAMWVLGGSPDLYKATGGTCRLGKPQG